MNPEKSCTCTVSEQVKVIYELRGVTEPATEAKGESNFGLIRLS